MISCAICRSEIDKPEAAETDSSEEILCLDCEAEELDEARELAFEARRRGYYPESYSGPRPFGLGFAEIPSSAITQSLAAPDRLPGGVFSALRLIAAVYAAIGLAAVVGGALALF